MSATAGASGLDGVLGGAGTEGRGAAAGGPGAGLRAGAGAGSGAGAAPGAAAGATWAAGASGSLAGATGCATNGEGSRPFFALGVATHVNFKVGHLRCALSQRRQARQRAASAILLGHRHEVRGDQPRRADLPQSLSVSAGRYRRAVSVSVHTASPHDVLARVCAENLAVYRASPARLQEDVSQESQVAHDYRGRLVYELLQNADDAMAGEDTTEGTALFRLTDTDLWVANNGRAFTELDVRGLCGLGASSKVRSDGPKRASIGHKGLGFKSVLEITEAPEAYSETVRFRLGRDHARDQVAPLWASLERGPVRGVPAMRFPEEIPDDGGVWLDLQRRGFHSAFRFPFHAGFTAAQRSALAQQLLTLPMTAVLFLKHLEQVIIAVETTEELAEREWLLERHRVTEHGTEPCGGLTESGLYRVDLVDRDGAGDRYWVAHNSDVRIGAHRDGLTGPAWEGVDLAEVSVASRDADDPRVEVGSRRFHVFLPTQEPLGCSLLVNGAFTTDLSRQRLRASDAETDYNGYLIGQAAETFATVLVPHLVAQRDAQHVLRVMDLDADGSTGAAGLLSAAVARAIAALPLLPSDSAMLSLSEAVVPTPLLDANGHRFAELLRPRSVIGGRRVPDPAYCNGELAAVCAAYGAEPLTPADTLRALAEHVDPSRALLEREPDGRFRLDPVLELCVALWENVGPADREALEACARWVPVFPVGENPDGTVNRITLGDESAFYPPRSSAEELPLRRLRFLAHAVCWGDLGRTEQRNVLEHRMKAWDALFEIKEFRFEEVMRAAVLPGLARDGDLDLRESNRTIEALATICRLAGKTTKPDQPLPLGRLGSDRAFFRLSRLGVPCRPGPDGELVWLPAHRVYFGRDWVGKDSVEDLVDAMAAAGRPLDIQFLASPQTFSAYAAAVGVDAGSDDQVSAPDDSDVEGDVDLEDDTDQVLETTADDRWRNYFAWLGVSRGLRLVHFHDVDDSGTGWTSTKGLGLPGGWAFAGLAKAWADYTQEITRALSSDARWASTNHYLYQVHTLDHFDEVAAAARLKDTGVAEALLAHLARNWALYARHTEAQVALVGAGKWPSSRTAPPRATSEELVGAGPDFWLFRLRRHAICPTSQGPRRPDQAWRRSDELVRRLGRSGREPDVFLPVLLQPTEVPASALRSCLDELRVRGELTPAAFTLEDARDLCDRLALLYAAGVGPRALRSELRPLYRQLFELLAGSAAGVDAQLADSPLAAHTADGVKFLPARDVVYASVSGSRERSGVQGMVPIFVLEAEPGALAPLRDVFGAPLLESALEWSVSPGEPALDGAGIDGFRAGLRELVPALLARLRADRADRGAADRNALLAFVASVEPVGHLALRCAFQGNDLGEIPQRTYYVSKSDGAAPHAFVVWSGPAWPPIPEDAQSLAMAIAETLEVNTVETFLSFINANDLHRRQLLDLAGAGERLDEVVGELAGLDGGAQAPAPVEADPGSLDALTTDGDATEADVGAGATPRPPEPAASAPRVPLHRFEDLLIDGQVISVAGLEAVGAGVGGASGSRTPRGTRAPASPMSPPRAAAGTDLSELDKLGMLITFAFERRRHLGAGVVVLPGDGSPDDADVLVVDVSSPQTISAACEQSAVVAGTFSQLGAHGISPLYPGFDVLTIKRGQIDRMIELKSSGVDAQVQAMSWNEWKTAQGPLQHLFWLYLVGNLRADLHGVAPFIRAVRDPFATLASSDHEDTIRKRTIQLRIREFAAADQMELGILRSARP